MFRYHLEKGRFKSLLVDLTFNDESVILISKNKNIFGGSNSFQVFTVTAYAF